MKIANLSCVLGNGLVAGFTGTLGITISQMIEMKITGRKPSKTPAQTVERIFGIEPKDGKAEMTLMQMAHWGYGTTWGLCRALLAFLRVPSWPATVLHWAAVQQTALLLLPGVKVAPPVKEWGKKQVAVEMGHHLVYALAASLPVKAAFRHWRPARRFRARANAGAGSSRLLALAVGSALAALFLAQADPQLAKQVAKRIRGSVAGRPRGPERSGGEAATEEARAGEERAVNHPRAKRVAL